MILSIFLVLWIIFGGLSTFFIIKFEDPRDHFILILFAIIGGPLPYIWFLIMSAISYLKYRDSENWLEFLWDPSPSPRRPPFFFQARQPCATFGDEILETPEDAEFRKLEVFFDYLMGPKGNRGAKFGHIKESFAILMNSPNPPRPKEEMGKTLSVFNKSITAAQKFKYEGKKDFMHHELKKMLQSYKEMEKIIYENEGELQKIMPGWKAEKYLDPNYVEPPPPKTDLIPEEDLEFLNKKAGNVSRWLKHQWLKMKNDIESYKALDIVEASKETRHRLDHLMDILENNDSSMDQIKEAIKSINGSFIYLIDKMMVVGKEYMIHQRRSERTKDRYMKEISLAEVRQMAESGRMLRDGFGGLPRL